MAEKGAFGQRKTVRSSPFQKKESVVSHKSITEQFAQREKHQQASFLTIGLTIAVLVSVCTLVFPARNYFRENARMSELRKEKKQVENDLKFWKDEATRGTDEKYIIAYAREHNALVMPDETPIHITNPDAAGTEQDITGQPKTLESDFSSDALKAVQQFETPWYQKIAESFVAINSGNNNEN